MTRKLVIRIILSIVLLLLIVQFFSNQPALRINHLQGKTMGSIAYNVKYLSEDQISYQGEVDSILRSFNNSLSTYIPDSELSQLNANGKINNPSDLLLKVMGKSEEVWISTYGAFDPTIGPLVNAWGFGPNKSPELLDSAMVDSLLSHVSFGKILFNKESIELEPGMYLDFSAIAKGYAVDLLADFLENKHLDNYMVEIGGEVKVKGRNNEGVIWKIGIENPLVEPQERILLAIAQLENMAMATSGNYRNFYELDGKVIAHTIDPRTGFNPGNNVLSASVFAKDCILADAYATAFMVMGLESVKALINQNDLEALIIYDNGDGLATHVSSGIASSIEFLGELEKPQAVQ